jgi:hypothetical protein
MDPSMDPLKPTIVQTAAGAVLAPLALERRAYQGLQETLETLDELGCHQAGAYVSMAIDVLERSFGDLLASDAAV